LGEKMAITESLDSALAGYDLGEFQGYRRIERGYVNEIWLIATTRGKYVLKRRHSSLRDPDLIAAQHALVQYLCSVGFPAPTLIPAKSGATFLQVEADIYEVQRFIPGELCNEAKAAHLAAAARTLGRYHSVVRGFDRSHLHRPRERYGPRALGRIVDQLMEDWAGRRSRELDQLIGRLQEHAQDLLECFAAFGHLPELVIHGDYYAENLIFRDDVVVGVVDYDQAHWCSRAIELAEALIYFARERAGRLKHIVYSGMIDLPMARSFLVAYGSTVGLTEAEIDVLPHLVRTIWLCASLDPPLRPRLRLDEAPKALPEVLALADWARVHTSSLSEIVRAAQEGHTISR
jgi:Ser/Thr protein kinase RdoA (MazF antagonist)